MAWISPCVPWHPLSMKGFEKSRLPRYPGPRVQEMVYLYPGKYHFATKPTMIHTVLGSCVSVVFFDRKNKYGAMCHAVLDSNPLGKQMSNCSKYMDCVIDEMVFRFAERGVVVQSLDVKIFGGAKMLGSGKTSALVSEPGVRNIRMARKILQEYHCRIISEDCGGLQGRKVYFSSHTGDVFLKKIRKNIGVYGLPPNRASGLSVSGE